MIVEYLDLKTGKKAKEDGISEFQLTQNNWSCDCNREMAFDHPEDTEEEYGTCTGCQRYIVISITKEPDDEPFDESSVIAEANYEYYLKTSAPQPNAKHRRTEQQHETTIMQEVNHPTHYNSHPSGIEIIEIIWCMNFDLGNAFKYLARANHKHDSPIIDLRKALWYIEHYRDHAPTLTNHPSLFKVNWIEHISKVEKFLQCESCECLHMITNIHLGDSRNDDSYLSDDNYLDLLVHKIIYKISQYE